MFHVHVFTKVPMEQYRDQKYFDVLIFYVVLPTHSVLLPICHVILSTWSVILPICHVINPLSPNIHKQILQTDLYTFPYRMSKENLIKKIKVFSLRWSFYSFS